MFWIQVVTTISYRVFIVVLADVLDPSSHCVVSLNGYVCHSCKVGFKMVFQKQFKMFLIVSNFFLKMLLKTG